MRLRMMGGRKGRAIGLYYLCVLMTALPAVVASEGSVVDGVTLGSAGRQSDSPYFETQAHTASSVRRALQSGTAEPAAEPAAEPLAEDPAAEPAEENINGTECAAGTADTDFDPATNCTICEPGTYAAAGSTACTACTEGTADADFNPATPCELLPGACESDPCLNGAACTDFTSDRAVPALEYRCTCVDGYASGWCDYAPVVPDYASDCAIDASSAAPTPGDGNCAIDVNECVSNPCLTGVCTETNVSAWACICPATNSGRRALQAPSPAPAPAPAPVGPEINGTLVNGTLVNGT